jgi:hypothetical protein
MRRERAAGFIKGYNPLTGPDLGLETSGFKLPVCVDLSRRFASAPVGRVDLHELHAEGSGKPPRIFLVA